MVVSTGFLCVLLCLVTRNSFRVIFKRNPLLEREGPLVFCLFVPNFHNVGVVSGDLDTSMQMKKGFVSRRCV